MSKTALLWAAACVILVIGVREIFPKRTTVHTPPEIITQWDTVEVMDTTEIIRWRTRVRVVTDTVNLIRTVTVAKTDTIYVLPRLYGLTALSVGEEWGDTMVMRGFEVAGDTSAITRRNWRSTAFVAGPLRTLVVDSLPPGVEFWPMPPPPCGFWCKAKIALVSGAAGAGAATLLCGVN